MAKRGRRVRGDRGQVWERWLLALPLDRFVSVLAGSWREVLADRDRGVLDEHGLVAVFMEFASACMCRGLVRSQWQEVFGDFLDGERCGVVLPGEEVPGILEDVGV